MKLDGTPCPVGTLQEKDIARKGRLIALRPQFSEDLP